MIENTINELLIDSLKINDTSKNENIDKCANYNTIYETIKDNKSILLINPYRDFVDYIYEKNNSFKCTIYARFDTNNKNSISIKDNPNNILKNLTKKYFRTFKGLVLFDDLLNNNEFLYLFLVSLRYLSSNATIIFYVNNDRLISIINMLSNRSPLLKLVHNNKNISIVNFLRPKVGVCSLTCGNEFKRIMKSFNRSKLLWCREWNYDYI